MPLVTTIIPAYNARATIQRTIASALAQSHANHEIVVVNDGSIDDTLDIVTALSRDEPRLRIVSHENRGLASARNSGIDAAAGEFVAPLDADDIWHPDKIARQVAAIAAMPDAAMAYGWFRNIDGEDRVLPGSAAPLVQGRVFHRHLDQNFISNGSSPLVRTEVARAVRYDPALALGCEDYMFQLQVARLHPVACVPAWLTGYRRSTGSMSTNALRMIDAHLQMFAMLLGQAGAGADAVIRQRMAALRIERARNRLRRGRMGEGLRALAGGFALDAGAAIRAVGAQAGLARQRLRGGLFAPPARLFGDYAIDAPDGAWDDGRTPARDAWLAELDAAH